MLVLDSFQASRDCGRRGDLKGSVFETSHAAECSEVLAQTNPWTSRRAVLRELVREPETMDLVTTWTDSRGRDGRVKQIETAFDPTWVHDAMVPYALQSDVVDVDAFADNAAVTNGNRDEAA